jgi:transposase
MSDHFDITLERKLESSADETASGIAGVRRIELITGAERRRRWSDDDKARIVVESFAPGANVSEVARRNGLSPQQLFAWRREARALFQDGGNGDAAVVATAPQPPTKSGHARELGAKVPPFVPVVIASSAPPSPTGCPPSPIGSGTIEIMIGDIVVRVTGLVETTALTTVLRAVRRSS